MAWYGMIWHDMAWYDMIWYDMIRHWNGCVEFYDAVERIRTNQWLNIAYLLLNTLYDSFFICYQFYLLIFLIDFFIDLLIHRFVCLENWISVNLFPLNSCERGKSVRVRASNRLEYHLIHLFRIFSSHFGYSNLIKF